VFTTFKRHFGADGDPAIMVAKAASRYMNRTLAERVIARAYERDATAASAEYGGEFRNDIESFVSREIVDACVERGCYERPYAQHRYFAFCDLASGSGKDSAALAIAHKDSEAAVLDLVREIRPPFNPQAAIAEFVDVLKAYRLHKIKGDRWSPGFVADGFGRLGIRYEVSTETKSDYYRELLPMLNSGRVDLIDNARLIMQICSLERRVARSGRDSIDAEQGAPEDVANAAAGALVNANGNRGDFDIRTFIGAYGCTGAVEAFDRGQK
jgi:hypothetical protein